MQTNRYGRIPTTRMHNLGQIMRQSGNTCKKVDFERRTGHITNTAWRRFNHVCNLASESEIISGLIETCVSSFQEKTNRRHRGLKRKGNEQANGISQIFLTQIYYQRSDSNKHANAYPTTQLNSRILHVSDFLWYFGDLLWYFVESPVVLRETFLETDQRISWYVSHRPPPMVMLH